MHKLIIHNTGHRNVGSIVNQLSVDIPVKKQFLKCKFATTELLIVCSSRYFIRQQNVNHMYLMQITSQNKLHGHKACFAA